MISFTVATPEDAAELAARMRGEDAREVAALGMTPQQALDHALEGSAIATTVRTDSGVLAMYGVVDRSVLGGDGLLWCLGSDEMPRRARDIMFWSPRIVASLQERYASLDCAVDTRYKQAVRWVERLGFKPVGSFLSHDVMFTLYRRT